MGREDMPCREIMPPGHKSCSIWESSSVFAAGALNSCRVVDGGMECWTTSHSEGQMFSGFLSFLSFFFFKANHIIRYVF